MAGASAFAICNIYHYHTRLLTSKQHQLPNNNTHGQQHHNNNNITTTTSQQLNNIIITPHRPPDGAHQRGMTRQIPGVITGFGSGIGGTPDPTQRPVWLDDEARHEAEPVPMICRTSDT